jgi:hypothetical protein
LPVICDNIKTYPNQQLYRIYTNTQHNNQTSVLSCININISTYLSTMIHIWIHMVISWNRGTPKSSIYRWMVHEINHPFLGTSMTMEIPIFRRAILAGGPPPCHEVRVAVAGYLEVLLIRLADRTDRTPWRNDWDVVNIHQPGNPWFVSLSILITPSLDCRLSEKLKWSTVSICWIVVLETLLEPSLWPNCCAKQ